MVFYYGLIWLTLTLGFAFLGKGRRKNAKPSSEQIAAPETVNPPPNPGKPSQSRDLKKFPLAAMFYQDLYKRSAKSKIKLDKAIIAIAEKYDGAKAVTADLKSFESTKQKVDGDYHGDWKKVTDFVRATLSFGSLEDLYAGVKYFNEKGLPLIYLKDRFVKPAASGYRDVNALFYDRENDVIGEIQFHLHSILKAKEEEHKIYEIIREIERAAAANFRSLTPEEKEKVQHLLEESEALYENAYQEALEKSK